MKLEELQNINYKKLSRLASNTKTTGKLKDVQTRQADRAELQQIQRELLKATNQRIRRLENKGYEPTREHFKSAKTNTAMVKNIREMQSYLGQSTSTIRGYEHFLKAQTKAVEEYGIDFQNDKEYQQFAKIYQNLKDKGYDSMLERIGYGKASERVAVFEEAKKVKINPETGRKMRMSKSQWERAIIDMLMERFK